MSQRQPASSTHVAPGDLYAALGASWKTMFGEIAPRGALVLLVAQFALETGWGASCRNFNLGNVKARPGGASDWTYYPCDEVLTAAEASHAIALDPDHCHVEHQDAHSVTVWFDPDHPYACFASYPSLAAAAAAWLLLQHAHFGAAWPALLTGDARAFAVALYEAHYFTAPPNRYAATLSAVARKLDAELPSDDEQIAAMAHGAIAELSLETGPETLPSPPPEAES